ncbi:MAG TPA: hypothetical protein VIT85_02165 [Solirubrobacterales bacterium]
MREAWTDERLDDLAGRMDAGFDRVDSELRLLRTETNARFDSMQKAMLQGFVALSASMLTAFVALFALIAIRL